jgi:hypothetical protein
MKKSKSKNEEKSKKDFLIDMADVHAGHVISHPFPEDDLPHEGKWLVLYIRKIPILNPRIVKSIRIAKVSEKGVFTSSSYQQEFHKELSVKTQVRYYGYMELKGKLKK